MLESALNLVVIVLRVVVIVVILRLASFRPPGSLLSFLSRQQQVVLGSLRDLLHPRVAVVVVQRAQFKPAVALDILTLQQQEQPSRCAGPARQLQRKHRDNP